MPELYQVIADRPTACTCGNPDYRIIGGVWICCTCTPGAKLLPFYNPMDDLRARLQERLHPGAEVKRVWKFSQSYIPASQEKTAKKLIGVYGYIETRKYPQNVTFYSHMGIAAARRHSQAGGGWRLYALAKAIDAQGLGKVKREDLREYVLSLGVQIRTFDRWLNQGRNAGLFSDVQSKAGDWFLLLVNAGIAADALNCATVGRKVTMKAALLIGTGWKARVEAAYMATHKGRPIARGTIQKLLNVPVSTQRYRDAQSKIKRVSNYAKSNIAADQIDGMKEHSNHKGLFVAGNKLIYWRLPNSYETSAAMIGGKGRARKANKIIRMKQSFDGLLIKQQALSFDSEFAAVVKLFYQPEQLTRAMRKIGRSDNRRPAELYSKDHKTRGDLDSWTANRSIIWNHCPV